MRIEELIIDGFKSYAARTVIDGWDPLFNAITGLNGSGKSNILDAICFVLGISTMSAVRASNLQDLIYKRGQAGVTKASVTIVFDNSDKARSPIGFNDLDKISITRQIVLGGTSKYLINGHRAQQQSVLQLFQSVQLNINNPNFLIMQGKITKVLNMPPSQILSLVAEAAGTKLFEDRREKAVKTMAKKGEKLAEIKALLVEKIEPKLEKLRREKKTFLEFQQTQTELDRLVRVVTAHEYVSAVKLHLNHENTVTEKRKTKELLDSELKALKAEAAALMEDLARAKASRDREMAKSGAFGEWEKRENTLSDELLRLKTSLNMKYDSLKTENKRLEHLKTLTKNLEMELQEKEAVVTELDRKYKIDHERLQNARETAARRGELLALLQTGVLSLGQTGGYLGQLQELKQKISDCDVEMQKAVLRRDRLLSEAKKGAQDTAEAKKASERHEKEIEKLKRELESTENELKKLGFDPSLLKNLREKERDIKRQIDSLQRQIDGLRMGLLDFQYTKPYPDFDPGKVKGVAARLVRLDSSNYPLATALEICAGGKLYNVVVDSEVTGSQLLEKGQLRKRVTLIPLNKISARVIRPEAVDKAKALCPGNVELALDLVDCDPLVVKAMQYIFGNCLVTKDPETSKKVTFDPLVRARSVTLEGDVYDPAGTLSGGSRRQKSSTLVAVQRYNNMLTELDQLKAELLKLRSEIQAQEQLSQQTMSKQKATTLARHAIELCVKRFHSSAAYSALEAQRLRDAELERLAQEVEKSTTKKTSLEAELSQLEQDMREFETNKGLKLRELEAELKESEKELEELEENTEKTHGEFQDHQDDLEKTRGDFEAAKAQQKEAEKVVTELEDEVRSMENESQKLEIQRQEAAARLEEERSTIQGISAEINELEQVLATKKASQTEKKLASQRLAQELSKMEEGSDKAKKRIEHLKGEFSWVTDEKVVESIIQQNPNINVSECQARITFLEGKFKEMRRKVNANIMSMIDNVEKKESALKKMIRTLGKDKAKIEETIEVLDEYKRETLVKTWQKVSEDFGAIFADLLPGAFAKLVIPEGKDITEGLEVKVMLGKVWKESLVELSGGQRSLVALSLILAFLQSNPAPMYILDEVDAALDLSHTQNIGHLIKTRFKGSQFVVVSLKEGMFTNANRVFRTRFQDGTSVVSMM